MEKQTLKGYVLCLLNNKATYTEEKGKPVIRIRNKDKEELEYCRELNINGPYKDKSRRGVESYLYTLRGKRFDEWEGWIRDNANKKKQIAWRDKHNDYFMDRLFS